jgi:hypothetical protein
MCVNVLRADVPALVGLLEGMNDTLHPLLVGIIDEGLFVVNILHVCKGGDTSIQGRRWSIIAHTYCMFGT